MNPTPSEPTNLLSANDIELISCMIAAPNQVVAAEWLGCSPTHLRRRLKDIRDRLTIETNAQLIVLASISGSINPSKVLPFGIPDGSALMATPLGKGATPATPVRRPGGRTGNGTAG